MTTVLAINGSYREDGITDQTVQAVAAALEARGATVKTIHLREHPIEFGMNCRACTQEPGDKPGKCVQNDGMQDIVDQMEEADAYILAAPTNLGSVTAIFKRFMERLIVYAYWPWGEMAPVHRKADSPKKKAILLSSCAAPRALGRLSYSSISQLETTAELIGADAIGSVLTGLVADEEDKSLSDRQQRRLERLARKLA